MRALLAIALAVPLVACSRDDVPTEERAAPAERSGDVEANAPSRPKGRFAPRDDCVRLEGGADFRARLAEAVRLRDADALVALADPAIRLDFGGGGGRDTLRERLTHPDYELWAELDRLLPLGCAAEGDRITMPWLFAQDIGDADPYASMLVLGEDEPVRAEPRSSAEEIATVSWDLVEAVSYTPERPFSEVRLPGGRTGFIAADKLRGVIDYRLLAERTDGRWQITALIAGD